MVALLWKEPWARDVLQQAMIETTRTTRTALRRSRWVVMLGLALISGNWGPFDFWKSPAKEETRRPGGQGWSSP